MTSVENLSLLKNQFERIIRSLEPSILLEHVRRLDPMVYARYFRGFRPQTLGRKRVESALRAEVYEKQNTKIGDILTILWNQENRDLYQAMLEHVRTVAENVETIERIEDDQANAFLDDLTARFEVEDLLVCVRLNEVRFSESVIATRLLGIQPEAEPAEVPPPAEEAPAGGEAEPGAVN